MAMGSTGGGDGLSSDINVTPLIDVLLVLLIIFMITQPMSRKAFDVQVPRAAQPAEAPAVEPNRARTEAGRVVRHQRPAARLEPAGRQVPRDLRPAASEAAVHQGGAEPEVRRGDGGDGHRSWRRGAGHRLHATRTGQVGA